MCNDEKGSMLGVEEVSERLNVSKSYAYRVIRRLNNDLKEQGILTIPGKLNSAYLEERYFATAGPVPEEPKVVIEEGGEENGGL